MKRIVRVAGLAGAMAIAIPASFAFAQGSLAVGTVAKFSLSECTYVLRSGDVFVDTDPETGECFPVAIGDQVAINYHRDAGLNEVDGIQRYEDEYTLGKVEAITSDVLTLNSGAEFDLTQLATRPSVGEGDYVRIEFVVTNADKNVATSVTNVDLGVVNQLQQQH